MVCFDVTGTRLNFCTGPFEGAVVVNIKGRRLPTTGGPFLSGRSGGFPTPSTPIWRGRPGQLFETWNQPTQPIEATDGYRIVKPPWQLENLMTTKRWSLPLAQQLPHHLCLAQPGDANDRSPGLTRGHQGSPGLTRGAAQEMDQLGYAQYVQGEVGLSRARPALPEHADARQLLSEHRAASTALLRTDEWRGGEWRVLGKMGRNGSYNGLIMA